MYFASGFYNEVDFRKKDTNMTKCNQNLIQILYNNSRFVYKAYQHKGTKMQKKIQTRGNLSHIQKRKVSFFLASCVLAGFASTIALAQNPQNFDPKSVKNHLVIKMEILDSKNNKEAGEVVAVQTPYGVAFFPNLKGLKSGLHGFHIHENPNCGNDEKGLGMQAGGHWDPKKTNKHSFTWDNDGHKGDLPALFVEKDGSANSPVLAPKIKNISEIKNHALMIHFGGDNHSDHPAPLGGGGARIACGVIQ